MSSKNKQGALSAKLIFVVLAGVGVMILLFSLMTSDKFETVELNLSQSQSSRQEQLKELGQITEDTHINGRILLNQHNIEKYAKEKNGNCDYELNKDMPTETETYESKTKSIEFSLPYNEDWGSEEFIVMPYDELEDKVYFGPLAEMPNCDWQRAYFMKLHKTQPKAEILADLSMRKLQGDWEFIHIGKIEVVKFTQKNSKYDNCLSPRYYVLGVDYDYEFVVNCSDDIERDFDFLKQIVLTIKF